MHKKKVYRVTLPNFEKYNPNIKKGHKSVLVSVGFLSDAKVRQLSPCGKLMLLSFILVAGESGQSKIEVSHESICYQSGVKSGSVQSQLDLLQSLQLLTYEKIDLLYNRIEKNIIEVSNNIKETKQPIDYLKLQTSPELEKLKKILTDFGLEKKLKKEYVKILAHFETAKALEEFITNVEKNQTVQELISQGNEFGAKQYISVAILRESGIIEVKKNENT